MQTLQHPNIMRIKDYFEDDNNMYMVMDYRLDDLRNLFTQLNGPFNEQFVKKIFHDLVSAVSYFNKLGIVHRDIKMENILLDYDDITGAIIIELTDFGLAK